MELYLWPLTEGACPKKLHKVLTSIQPVMGLGPNYETSWHATHP